VSACERPARRSGSPIDHPTERRGFSEEAGSWHGQLGRVLAAEQDGSARRRHEARDRAAERRLAGAGFADDAEHLAAPDVEADSGECEAAATVRHLEVSHRDKGFAIGQVGRMARALAAFGEAWHGREELLRVRLLRAGDDGGSRALFDRQAPVEHDDLVGDLADDAHVVRDEQHAQVELAHEPAEQVEDAALNRDVEGRGGLVGDEQMGRSAERHRDQHALQLAARHLVRVGGEDPFGIAELGLREQFGRAVRGGGTAADPLAHPQQVAEDPADLRRRGEGAHGLLEHDADAVRADLAEPRAVRADELLALEAGAARDGRAVRRHPDRGERGDALPGSGFADERRDAPGVDRQADAAHDLTAAEGDPEVLEGEEVVRHSPSVTVR
jgi:predicted RNA-binding protein YlqC (UPF0109 family)